MKQPINDPVSSPYHQQNENVSGTLSLEQHDILLLLVSSCISSMKSSRTWRPAIPQLEERSNEDYYKHQQMSGFLLPIAALIGSTNVFIIERPCRGLIMAKIQQDTAVFQLVDRLSDSERHDFARAFMTGSDLCWFSGG
jgi:hypothetical protein